MLYNVLEGCQARLKLTIYLLLYESLILRWVGLRLRPGGSQGSHEVGVGRQLGGVLGELQARTRLPSLQHEVSKETSLVVEQSQDEAQQDNHDDDNDDHSFGT